MSKSEKKMNPDIEPHLIAAANHPKGFNLDPKTGKEVPDPVPMEPPLGYIDQPSILDLVADMLRKRELDAAARAEGYETEEEADDFEVGEDFEPGSIYEHDVVDAGLPPHTEGQRETAAARAAIVSQQENETAELGSPQENAASEPEASEAPSKPVPAPKAPSRPSKGPSKG